MLITGIVPGILFVSFQAFAIFVSRPQNFRELLPQIKGIGSLPDHPVAGEGTIRLPDHARQPETAEPDAPPRGDGRGAATPQRPQERTLGGDSGMRRGVI